jgi:hypothetical protein
VQVGQGPDPGICHLRSVHSSAAGLTNARDAVQREGARARGVRRGDLSPSKALALGRRLEEIIAEHTGQPLAKVVSDLERDYYMSSEEALASGVIDRVISHR